MRQIRSFINKQSRKEWVIETHSLITEQFESENGLDSDRGSIVWLGVWKELVIETHSLIIEQYESESGLDSDREFINSVS